jgi:hypothetical protein
MKEQIYGVTVTYPQIPSANKIANRELPPKQQYFRRAETPEVFNELDYDDDGDPIYTEQMLEFIHQELDRIDNGYFFYNNQKLVYITGEHYFYINYWTLENDERPDYRDCDRRWFLFKDYCQQHPSIDGVIRIKKRREGATSQETACLVRTALRNRKAFCGIMSKTGKDAKDCFVKMVKNGFDQLPIFLRPTNIEDPDSQMQIVFRKPKERSAAKLKLKRRKGQVFEDDKGIGSRIDFRNTELNSYDSGRLTEILVDEGGKFPPDVPINEYWPIVRQTLRQGGKKVGFCVMPSTSNKLTKGGRGYKVLWDESNHIESKITATGLYRYFCPAHDGYPPFIDKYGNSIIEKPTREQQLWMKEYYGATDDQCEMSAKEYILYRRSLIRNMDARNEETRMFPLNEKEAFDFDDNTNIYNLTAIRDQREYLTEKRPVLRRVRFTRDRDGKATWINDPDGMWLVLRFPDSSEENATMSDAVTSKVSPANRSKYILTADPYKNTIVVGQGSKGAAIVWSKFNPLDPENTGMPIALFWGRPRRKKEFHMQMLLAGEFWGCELCYESDYDDYIEFLMDEGKMSYAMKRPKNTIDPNRKRKVMGKEYGVKSGDGFSYSMMIDRSVEYVDQYCHKIYFDDILDQLEEYSEEERTLYDIAVAFQLGTVAISDPVKKTRAEAKKMKPYMRTYQL